MVIRPATPNAPNSLSQKRAHPLPRIKLSKSTFVGRVSLSLTLLVEPPPTLTSVHKLTEKTNENSNNKASHGIQAIENENSDLAQVIELVKMISNIIKRSPEILQLLPKLKNSEDDKAKALFLFEATDEAHFWLNGYVNKQNCCIWSEANPQLYVETPLHPERLTAWCALWAGGIIGPYFFKTDEGHNVTVNGDRYRAIITNFFIPELNNHDVQELWFRQDGATCHTARATIDLLKDTLGDRLISRFGPVNWPPRTCDLTPLDYFLWGYVKSFVYADKPQTLDHLEDNIRRVIVDIRPQMLEKVIENWTSRLDYIRTSRGSPMPEIIFKM
ncbi:putative transposable element [Trichonephila clavipes]|nr:putative transposable element [Trichonephila clavipes]